MSSTTLLKTTVPGDPGIPGADPPDQSPGAEIGHVRFRSFLTIGLLRSRWLRPYSTPCHSRGAMV
jgi:hypothetical protein